MAETIAGVSGPGGAVEKDVTLAIARRLKATIEGRLGMRVLLTHDDDNRLDADRRAAIANNNKADLFISLHANGSPRQATRGAIVFTLSLDRFGEEARRQSQAAREVLPVFGGGSRDFSLIEWELAQAAHLDGSNAFAGIVDQKLRTTAGMPAVTLERAPMRSLAGANMPAILIELGYLSNPEEEKLLTSAAFQNGIALALTESVVAFRDHLEQRPEAPADAMKKFSRTLALYAGIAVLLGGGLVVLLFFGPRWLATPPPQEAQEAAPAPADARKIRARLFYVNEQGTGLTSVEQEVIYGEAIAEQAKRIVEAQLAAPQQPLASAIPPDTKLRTVFVTLSRRHLCRSERRGAEESSGRRHKRDPHGIRGGCCADDELAGNHQRADPGGRPEVDTLAGHLDLRRPIEADAKLITD